MVVGVIANTTLILLNAAFSGYNIRSTYKNNINNTRWLISLIIVFMIWSVVSMLLNIVKKPENIFLFTNIFMIIPFTASSLWLMFCYEYTIKKKISSYSYLLFPIVILVFILGFINPHDIIYSVDPMSGQKLVPASPDTLRFFLNIILGYMFVLLGSGMLIVNVSKSASSIRSKQSLMIALLSIFGILTSLPKVLSLDIAQQFDPMILGIILFNISIAVAINIYDFSKIDYLDKEEIIDNYNDIVISCNSEDEILYMNKFAKEKLGDIESNTDINTLIDEKTDDYIIFNNIENEYYHIDKYQIGKEQKVYSFSNLTDLISKNQQINLWNDISDRVLRHNVRNDINVISGYSEILKDSVDDPNLIKYVNEIEENANSLESTSKKLRDIEKVIHSSCSNFKLSDTIKNIVNKNKHKNINIKTSIKSEKPVYINNCFNMVVSEIMNNSAEHNNSEQKYLNISIRTEDSYTIITFEDNGKGISKYEQEVINSESEDNHNHGSGCGLWLIKMFVIESNGCLEIEQTNKGSKIIMKLPNASKINTDEI